MSKKKIFDDDSEEEVSLKTENEYAKRYDSWREKEEIHKLEQKYGPDALTSDALGSSDSEDESDVPPDVSEEVEEQFLKTLALLKTKDPRIYDPDFKCFEQDEDKKSDEKLKPKTLTFDDTDDEDDGGDIFKIEKKAVIDDESTQKEISSDSPEKSKKSKKLKDYLTGKVEHVDNEVEKDLAPLKALWSDPKLNEGEAFLRDYILNKRYLEEGDLGEGAEKLRDDVDLEADEQTVEEQNKFERAYNFRFEEPDEEYLKRFPRTMSTIRPKDDRRSRKRAEVRARKEEEKRRKMEEIARLKAHKLKEIQEKIAKIKEVTGNEELAFKEEDIEGDFDPADHDRRMKALFDEEYYGEADDQKPVFPDLDEELEIENWDKFDPEKEDIYEKQDFDGEVHCEDDDFNMDADYDPTKPRAQLQREIEKTLGKKRRNRKRKSKLAELLTTEKPKFIPNATKTYDEYMEEYYKMDCEDVVGGDLPTRFKYRQVVPNDYGLTIEEILLADDKELTQWVPLKRIVRHRPENIERGEVKTYAQRAADSNLKKKVLPSLFRELPEEPELVVPVEEKSKKKKKKKKKSKESTDKAADAVEADAVAADATGDSHLIDNENAEPIDNEHAELKSDVKRKKKKKQQIEDKNKDKESSKDNLEIREIGKEELILSSSAKSKNEKDKSMNINDATVSKDNNVSNSEASNVISTEAKRNKKKKNNKSKVNGIADSGSKEADSVSNNLSEKKKIQKLGAFVIEDVSVQRPTQETSIVVNNVKKGAKQQNKQRLKRKLEGNTDANVPRKKHKQDLGNNKNRNKKGKQQDKLKSKNKNSNDKSNDNPLSKLSDERLKAYGLNPKKYKNFLKYKKF